ncbi:MAG: 4-hydroxy-tetrahydrodipicolinate synthase [Bacteroidetes bacterium HGW-Bacteroidetes-21]|jgi:4-hydroxy-tetrahydrodipicolinate synthase|nr:MAG: 4-hydroxy-tetrahydrodipicolinate synthase [Bacteroidetes bacterium HGW-Bacteroidetes-21]
MSAKKFKGTGVAIITPFNVKGEIDWISLEKIVNYLNRYVDYLVVLGTTGENPVLSDDEKLQVIQHVISYNAGKIPVVVGVGGYDSQDLSVKLKKISAIEGIDAILSVTPYYNKPSQIGLYEHYKLVAQSSILPIILYNVPGRTGCNLLPETILKLASDFSNIIGVKEASGNPEQIMNLIHKRKDGFLVISGDDALTLPLIAAGADGLISVTANALPELVSRMVKAALNDTFSEARAIHYSILDFTSYMFKEGSPAGVKSALCHLNLCENVLRLPLVPVSIELNQLIKSSMEKFTLNI